MISSLCVYFLFTYFSLPTLASDLKRWMILEFYLTDLIRWMIFFLTSIFRFNALDSTRWNILKFRIRFYKMYGLLNFSFSDFCLFIHLVIFTIVIQQNVHKQHMDIILPEGVCSRFNIITHSMVKMMLKISNKSDHI